MPIQIILIVFIAILIYTALNRYRKSAITGKQLLLWMVVWILGGVIIATPSLSQYIAHLIGIGRGSDLVLYTSVILIFSIIFQLFVKQEKMERDITTLVRSLAIQEKQGGKESN